MKKLKRFGLVLLILCVVLPAGFVGTAVFTNPAGVAAAIRDPGEAIQNLTTRIELLAARVIGLEDRIAALEKELEIHKEPEELEFVYNEADYPYLAQLPPDLEGMIEVRYNWEITIVTYEFPEYQISEYWCEYMVTNFTDKPLVCIFDEYILRDVNGEIVAHGRGGGGEWRIEEDWTPPDKIHGGGMGGGAPIGPEGPIPWRPVSYELKVVGAKFRD